MKTVLLCNAELHGVENVLRKTQLNVRVMNELPLSSSPDIILGGRPAAIVLVHSSQQLLPTNHTTFLSRLTKVAKKFKHTFLLCTCLELAKSQNFAKFQEQLIGLSLDNMGIILATTLQAIPVVLCRLHNALSKEKESYVLRHFTQLEENADNANREKHITLLSNALQISENRVIILLNSCSSLAELSRYSLTELIKKTTLSMEEAKRTFHFFQKPNLQSISEEG
eukprot:g6130.t1